MYGTYLTCERRYLALKPNVLWTLLLILLDWDGLLAPYVTY